MSSFLNNHMMVDDVEIESLVKIHFTTSSNILINSYVKLIICDETHYFKVNEIKACSISTILDVIAIETGSRSLHKQKDLDLRKLCDLKVEVVVNIDEIANIERMSKLC